MSNGDFSYGIVHARIAELHAFHVAANSASFTAAARRLRLTQPALSQKIRRLEELLGTRLFVRRYRGVSLTESGQRLHDASKDALAQLERSFHLILEDPGRRRVRLATDFAFASHWLMSRLPRLRDDLEGLDIQVLTSQQPGDTEGIAIDLTIALMDRPRLSRRRHLLFDERVTAVCSRETLARYGPFEHPAQLLKAPLLSLTSPPNAAWHDWRSWFRELGVEDMASLQNETRLSNYTLVLQGAIDSQGVALGWLGLVDSFLAGGQLVTACDRIVSSERAYVIEYAGDASDAPPEQVERVFDWISAACRTQADPPGLPPA